MENRQIDRYPVGQQSFEQLRLGGYVYVDKSRFIPEILHHGQYFFLGRPRRFGKSLFLSMLRCFFEGRKELFEGLEVYSMERNWDSYPVFYLDMNNQQYTDDGDLDTLFNSFLDEIEEKYRVKGHGGNHSARLANLIRTVAEKTGKDVVFLVDEYDKPLVNNINSRERFEKFRNKLAAFYSNFKSSADYLRMVFLTGVSRFGKLSVFSGLNNIQDISFADKFATICGLTEDELRGALSAGVASLAAANGVSVSKELEELKQWYDGYHFTPESPDIYNPYSILNALSLGRVGSYWVASGAPTLLVEQLKRTDADLEKISRSLAPQSELEGLDADRLSTKALLYQTGYLTIKGYDAYDDLYTLGIPNEEVKRGFFEFLLPFYANLGNENPRVFVVELRRLLEEGKAEEFVSILTSLFAGISYEMKLDEEKNVQNALFILFCLLGVQTEVEYRTSSGRIDILIKTKEYIYIIELKFNGSAKAALEQIISKGYAHPWKEDGRSIIAIGLNYSSSKRSLTESEIEVIVK